MVLHRPVELAQLIGHHPTREVKLYQEWDFWLSIGTLILAAITGWLAWETRQMRRGSDKALGKLVEQATAASLAAGASSQAAKDSAGALKALAITGQRGWLLVKKIDFHPGSAFNAGDNVIHSLYVTLQNVGRTPIKDIVVTTAEVLAAELPVNFALSPKTTVLMIAPNETETVRQDYLARPPDQPDFNWEKTRMYFVGKITYKDVFDEPHYSSWGVQGRATGSWLHLDHYNTLD